MIYRRVYTTVSKSILDVPPRIFLDAANFRRDASVLEDLMKALEYSKAKVASEAAYKEWLKTLPEGTNTKRIFPGRIKALRCFNKKGLTIAMLNRHMQITMYIKPSELTPEEGLILGQWLTEIFTP